MTLRNVLNRIALLRFALLALLQVGVVAATLCLDAPDAHAQGQSLVLRVGESKTLFAGRATVAIGNPSVIDVRVDGEDIIVFGVAQGYSSLTVGDLEYEITVLGDVEQLRRDIERLLSDSPRVSVFTSGDGVVIDGVVNSRAEAERINGIVESSGGSVYSLVVLDERQIPERQQVQLHFQFVEVERSNNHQLGMNWSQGPVQFVLDAVSTVRFGVSPTPNLDQYIDLTASGTIARVLDQDFITCASGEDVEYRRGGEMLFTTFNQQEGFGLVTKEYGLSITARPIVDDDGDIDLILDYELSSPTATVNGIPNLRTHQHAVSVQLQEGQSFALSGWYTRDRSRTISGIPGLKDIPVLGMLFGSREFRRGNTDGIIIVTPVVLDQGGQKMRRQIRETMDLYEQAEVKW